MIGPLRCRSRIDGTGNGMHQCGSSVCCRDNPMGDPHHMATETTNQIRSIAEVLAASFSAIAVSRILGEHVPDSTGHCRGCWYPTTASPVWPCRLWEIGHEAERIKQASPRP